MFLWEGHIIIAMYYNVATTGSALVVHVPQASGLKCPSSVTGDNLANSSWVKSPEPITCQKIHFESHA